MVVERIVVVGAGECGARVVTELRERGFTGSLTLVGDEPHAPYERPPLSKAAIVDLDDPAPATVLAADRLAALDVTVALGVGARRIDRDRSVVVLGDGTEIAYDRLLLATGARARTLPIPGFEHVKLLRTFDEALVLRNAFAPGVRVGVIGAGFIGLELAASARQRGAEVVVLEAAPRPLGRAVPADIAEVIVQRHLEAGVQIRCGVGITAIDHDGEDFRIGLVEGPPVDVDVVVAGVGAVPNVELAEAARLTIDNGIAVDGRLQTSDPAIYAAGDCCSMPHELFGGRRIRLESWRNAHDQAVVAGANLLGGTETHTAVPWFWSDQFDLGLQLAGWPDAATDEVVRVRPDGTFIRFGLDPAGRLVSAGGVAPGTGVAKDIRLAEMMIAGRVCPDPAALADPTESLKQLLRA